MTVIPPFFNVSRDSINKAVAILEFNRPQCLNALSVDMGVEFKNRLEEINADKSIRCLILTGSGRAFSAGGDLQWLQERINSESSDNAATMRSFYKAYISSLINVRVPTIAAINGLAVGAGACLTLGCDIRIAADSAKFGFNFVNLGIPPGMAGSFTLPILIGIQNASRVLLTGEMILADEAKKLGLVLDCVNNPLEESLQLGRKIANASPVAVQMTTKALRMRFFDGSFERALQREADSQAIAFTSKDYKEGLLAIIDKRAPKF